MMNTNVIASALRANGYYLDTISNILYMSAPYEKKSNVYGTQEYKMVCSILAQFPDVQISIQKKSRKNTLSYDMMKDFIKMMPGSADMLKEFERIQLMSHAYSSPYKYVENWFFKKYPYYGDCMAKDAKGNTKWDIVALYRTAEEQKAAKAESAAEEPVEAPKLTLLTAAL